MITSDIPHPLETIVIDMIMDGALLDVTSVSQRLSGCTSLISRVGNKAYAVVAADVLCYMTSQKKLIQKGKFPGVEWKGGPVWEENSDYPIDEWADV